MELTWVNLGWSLGFVVSGLALMLIGLIVFDWLTPYKLFKEVEQGNEAVSWLVAGFVISTGLVLGEAFRSHGGWVQAMMQSGIGMVLNYLAYFLWEWCTPNWSLNEAITKGSTGAGKVLFGLFVATGLIIAGALQ